MKEIKCPYDLNQFLLGEIIFENTFPEKECEMRKFYGDCFHCFATSIRQRDKQLVQHYNSVLDKIRVEIEGYRSTINNAISKDELKIEGIEEAFIDCLELIDKYKESEDKE